MEEARDKRELRKKLEIVETSAAEMAREEEEDRGAEHSLRNKSQPKYS